MTQGDELTIVPQLYVRAMGYVNSGVWTNAQSQLYQAAYENLDEWWERNNRTYR